MPLSATTGSEMQGRAVVTGMAIISPFGDTLPAFFDALLQGRSAVRVWHGFDTSHLPTRLGADLADYDLEAKVQQLKPTLPDLASRQLARLHGRVPWSVEVGALNALDAIAHAGLPPRSWNADRSALVVCGHNLNVPGYYYAHCRNPDLQDIDAAVALKTPDAYHASTVSELLGIGGPIAATGAACASGNVGLQQALGHLGQDDCDIALVLAPPLEFSPLEFQSLAMLGATVKNAYLDAPDQASRPFDRARCGFVPAQLSACLVVERLAHALARGAHIYGEVLSVAVNSDMSRSPEPNSERQAAVMTRALKRANVAPNEVGAIVCHGTSTVKGDTAEARAILQVFGAHTQHLKANAVKSMLGHSCTSAGVVGALVGLLQLQAQQMHPTRNVAALDTDVAFDVCASGAIAHKFDIFVNNAFGLGGINSAAVFSRLERHR